MLKNAIEGLRNAKINLLGELGFIQGQVSQLRGRELQVSEQLREIEAELTILGQSERPVVGTMDKACSPNPLGRDDQNYNHQPTY